MKKKDIFTNFGLYKDINMRGADLKSLKNGLRRILYLPSLIMFRAAGGGINVRKYRRMVRELVTILNDCGIVINKDEIGTITSVDLREISTEDAIAAMKNIKNPFTEDQITAAVGSDVTHEITINKQPNQPN